jgi:hypothetical protein
MICMALNACPCLFMLPWHLSATLKLQLIWQMTSHPLLLAFFDCPMILSPNSGVVQLTENHKPTSRKLLPTFPPAQVATPVELYFHTCSEYSALSNDHTRKLAEHIPDTTSSAAQCKPGHDHCNLNKGCKEGCDHCLRWTTRLALFAISLSICVDRADAI